MIARYVFWIWRRTRPFWGGLLVIVGASEMLASEQDPLPVVTQIGMHGLVGPFPAQILLQDPVPAVTQIGMHGLAGYLIPVHMLLFGVLLWLNPVDRVIYSLIAISLALGSWITSNLGGFFVGMLLGVVGGALAFAWTRDAEFAPPRWVHGKPRIALPAGRPDLAIQPKGHAPPQLEGRAAIAGSTHAALSWAGEMKLADLTDDESQGVRDEKPGSGRTGSDG